MVLDEERLEEIYRHWNHREFVSPDPLETVLPFSWVKDREIAAIVASSLAYGKVAALLPAVRRVLSVMGSSPADYVTHRSASDMEADLGIFAYRFAKTQHVVSLLAGVGAVVRKWGSLEQAFLGPTVDPAESRFPRTLLADFVSRILLCSPGTPGHLLAQPYKGGACKRLHLFLRWMVRRDDVDPGGWDRIDPSTLVMPLDTWIHRIALKANWTIRRSADARTALEITQALSVIRPDDPCRYDFALSRFGIRSDADLSDLFIDKG